MAKIDRCKLPDCEFGAMSQRQIEIQIRRTVQRLSRSTVTAIATPTTVLRSLDIFILIFIRVYVRFGEFRRCRWTSTIRLYRNWCCQFSFPCWTIWFMQSKVSWFYMLFFFVFDDFYLANCGFFYCKCTI